MGTPMHVTVTLMVVRFLVDRHRSLTLDDHQVHTAPRAVAGMILTNVGMHGTGVDDSVTER